MSKSVLEQLFDGEIYPAESIRPESQEYKDLSKKIDEEKEYFKSILSEADRKHFDDFCDMIYSMHSVYAYADFSYGYKLGAQLAYAATFEDKKKREHEIEERFDREMRESLLDAANEFRTENGLPLLTKEDVTGLSDE